MYLYNLCSLKGALKGHLIEKSTVNSLVECGLKCASLLPDCKSLNYITKHPGQSAICEINNGSKSRAHKDDFVRQPNSEYFETIANENQQDNQDVKQVYVCVVCVCVFLCNLSFILSTKQEFVTTLVNVAWYTTQTTNMFHSLYNKAYPFF